jgi:hypothetical protein
LAKTLAEEALSHGDQLDALRARIAELEAERDAAKAEEAGYTPQQIAEYAIYLKASRDVLEERKKWLGAEETHETTNE